MRIIGVTGGAGAGKSLVLDYLHKRYGAEILRLDDVSRRLLERGGACVADTVKLFGSGIVLDDGRLDRKKIADIIFQDEEKREQLDAIIHPRVKEESLRWLDRMREAGAEVAVIEAALLIEENYDEICDELWYIYADEATRASRMASSRGYSNERIRGTMSRQLGEAQFRAHTDHVIDNSGAFENTCARIDSLM